MFKHMIAVCITRKDLEERQWFHLDEQGSFLFDLDGNLVRVSPGKGKYSIVHNYWKFWAVYDYLTHASFVLWLKYYELFSEFQEVPFNLHDMFLMVVGCLPQTTPVDNQQSIVKINKKRYEFFII